jgi:DNA gyrase/topoisomerase IV subunit B
MTITVLPGYMAVRKRPQMYFGVAQDDARLPEMILRWVVRDTLAEVAVGEALHVVVTIDSDLIFSVCDDGSGMPVDPVKPSRPPWLAETLTHLWCGGDGRRGTSLGVAAALCSRVLVKTWRDGFQYVVEMNQEHDTSPLTNLGATARHGTCMTLWLDRDYLPRDAGLPAVSAGMAAELVDEFGRPHIQLTLQDQRRGRG